jgi:5'(3')-deoxyribonucleotidase
VRRPKLLYVDMDNVLVDFPSGVARLDAETRRAYEGRLDEVPGIFALMDPLPGAVAAFTRLAQSFDAYVLSTAPWENPSAWSDKLLWVQRHLGPVARKRLILTHHKDLNAGDFLVDDRLKNGAERFGGEHLHFGTERFPDWPAVLAYLLARAG